MFSSSFRFTEQFAEYQEWATFALLLGVPGLKSLQLQGEFAPDLPTRSFAAEPRLGIRSRPCYRLALSARHVSRTL